MLHSLRTPALLLSLVFTAAAAAEVKITPEERVPNLPPGRCGWCVLETLARHHRIRALYGLTEDNPTRADPEDLLDVLEDAHVPYRIQYPGEFGTRILKYAVRKNLGAAVGFRELFPGAGGHIVTLVDFQAKYVKVVDPSDQEFMVRTMPMDRFLMWWDGFALVVEKPKPARKVVKK